MSPVPPEIRVAGEVEGAGQAGGVVAGVVDAAGGRPVRHRRRRDQIAGDDLGGVEPEAGGGDGHRALQSERQLGAAEAPVQPRRAAVGDDDPAADLDVADPVGPGDAAVHPVERGRFRRPHVGADVVDQIQPQCDQVAGGAEPRLDLRQPLRRHRRGEQVLDPVLRPPDGYAETARRQRHQHHRREHARLHAERPAGVGRRDQPQPGRRQAQRRRRHAVEGEQPWKFDQAVTEPDAGPRRRSRRRSPPACTTTGDGGTGAARPDRRRPAPPPRRRRRTSGAGRDVAADRVVEHRRPHRQRRLRRGHHRPGVVLHRTSSAASSATSRSQATTTATGYPDVADPVDRAARCSTARPMADGNGRDSAATSALGARRRRPAPPTAARRQRPRCGRGPRSKDRRPPRRCGAAGRGRSHEPALAPEEGVVLDPLDQPPDPGAGPGRRRRRSWPPSSTRS